MLELKLESTRFFNEENNKFFRVPEIKLELEHSLLSLSKWESIWEVPFLSQTKKNIEQIRSYVECMSDEPIGEETLARLTELHYKEITHYIERKHSATWFSDEGKPTPSSQAVTAELIYYWMTASNIPFEAERWPLARLMNLIKICSIKNNQDPKKSKRSRSQMLSERAALNAKRKAELGTNG